MRNWQPITEAELANLIEKELKLCSAEQKDMFNRLKVPLKKRPIERYGKTEQVFVVAQNGNEVMYCDDVDEGFNISPVSTDGKILEHICNQDGIKHALRHWNV